MAVHIDFCEIQKSTETNVTDRVGRVHVDYT